MIVYCRSSCSLSSNMGGKSGRRGTLLEEIEVLFDGLSLECSSCVYTADGVLHGTRWKIITLDT